MGVKISDLPLATSVGDSDIIPIVQSGVTKKVKVETLGTGGGGGTSDYTDLTNKPSINSVTLTGDKTSGDLNLVGSADIATTIDSTSTNSEVAGAKAVYDYAQDNYSTTEQVVGTWIDGKPLYEQTFKTTAPSVGTDGNTNYKHIPLANIDFGFIVIAVAQYGSSPHSVWSFPYYNDSMRYIKAFVEPDNNQIAIASNGTVYTGTDVYIVVRYTKTTDSASN